VQIVGETAARGLPAPGGVIGGGVLDRNRAGGRFFILCKASTIGIKESRDLPCFTQTHGNRR
jgi:hypothetical protein